MDLPFKHEDFQGRDLVIRSAGLFKSARLLVDRIEVVGKRSKYTVNDNQGRPRVFKLKMNGLDPVPKVEIDSTKISITRSLSWYEYVWMALPIVLVFAGGALGGFFGLIATYTSARIFRSDRKTGVKYALTGGISIGAVIAFFVFAGAIQFFIDANRSIASKEALQGIANSTNINLPEMVDEHTELLKLEGLEGILVYYFRLPKVQPGQITEGHFLEKLRPVVTKNACANAEVREKFLNNGVTLRYVYSDSKDGKIAQFDVTNENCL